MKESNNIKEARLVDWVVEINRLSEKFGYTVEEMTRCQIRLSRGSLRVDIYPKGKRCFFLWSEVWGDVEEIKSFIESTFGNHEEKTIEVSDLEKGILKYQKYVLSVLKENSEASKTLTDEDKIRSTQDVINETYKDLISIFERPFNTQS